MGCNESKHDAVATGNTTAAHRRKPSFNMKTHKDLEPILEVDGEVSNKDSDSEVVAVAAAAADMKDINVNTEMNKKEEKEGMVEEEESRVVFVGGDSPDRYFSSRKDEDGIKAIVEGAEETGSGYCTPRHEPEPEADKDDFYDDADDADHGKQKLTKNEEKLGPTIENGKESSSDTPTK